MGKKIVKLLTASVSALLLLSSLSGCGSGKNSNAKGDDRPILKSSYEKDLQTLDYTFSQLATDSTIYSNLIDGLFENDPNGNTKPAMCTSWSVSSDGLTYTYKIRKGVKWMQSDGSEYAEVKPSDWVAGLKHAVENKSQQMYIIQDSIKNLDKFIAGTIKDFSQVGVKADNKKMTLTYNLNAPEPFWNSKTLYGILSPINEEFLKSKKKKFGGITPEGILYNGPYILSENTNKSVIKLKANANYWDSGNVHFSELNYKYWNGTDQGELYRSFNQGESDIAQVFASDPTWKEINKSYSKNILTSPPSTASFFSTFNLNRKNWSHTTDGKNKEGTQQAILNKNFRLAFAFAIDKKAYNAQTIGGALAKTGIRNSFVSPSFVKINQHDYGNTLQEEMDRLNPDWKKVDFAEDNNNSSYQPAVAKKYFAKAKEELQASGVKFPIHLDVMIDEADNKRLNQTKSLKASVEKSLGTDQIVIDIQKVQKEIFDSSCYQITNADNADWDFNSNMGWSPDYADPSSYLGAFNLKDGAMTVQFGLNPLTTTATAKDKEVAEKSGLNKFEELLEKANKINELKELDQRYIAFAKTESYLLDNGFIIGLNNQPTVYLTKLKPFSYPSGVSGINFFQNTRYQNRYKYTKLQKNIVTQAEYKKAEKEFNKRNEKAHVLGQVKEVK